MLKDNMYIKDLSEKSGIGSEQDIDLVSSRLNILGCEVCTMNLPDMQSVKYIKIPKEPFSTIETDFDKGVHLKILNDIAEKFNKSEERRIMFIVENQQTGLLACSYLSALFDSEEYNRYVIEDDEESIDFSGKIPMISASEISGEEQRNISRNLSFNCDGLNMQSLGGKENSIPWFEKYTCTCPLIVLLNDTTFLPVDLPKRLNDLGQSFKDIFVICEREPENESKNEVMGLGSFGLRDILEIANDISFESNYDTYKIDEPDIKSEYYRKVLEGAAESEGYSIDESIDRNEVLKNLKKFRSRSWSSNLTILQLVKKAVSMKHDGNVLKQQDFDFLNSNLIMMRKQSEKSDAIEKSATEKMNMEIYGLNKVKKTILDTVSVLKMRSEREKAGLKVPRVNNTFVFLGPPGAGKTEMAEHLTKILFENDLLPGKRFISINAAQLKGAYVGHTAPTVTAIFESNDAIFLDEAYSLTANQYGKGSMDIFSQEALAQLCVELEKHATDKLVIFAGYGGDVDSDNNKMKEFLNANPGIASRITFTVEFPSYSPYIEMPEILNKIVTNAEYDLEDGWRDIAIEFFREREKSESFGNGREARRLFQNAMTVQAARLLGQKTEKPDITAMRIITCSDLKTATSKLLESERQIVGKQQYRIGFGS